MLTHKRSLLLYVSYSYCHDFLVVFSQENLFNLGSVNNKTSSQETRDGKKHKKSVQQDNSLSTIFDTGDVTKPSPFWNFFFFLYEVMQHKIPKEVKLKIILCNDYKAFNL